MPPRKCSREDCPSQHVNIEFTVKCHRCKCQIHLPCYGVSKTSNEIFVTPNIVMICDICLETGGEEPSPKRRVLVQRKLDSNMALTIPSTESPVVKSPQVKPAMNKTIESLSMEIKAQTTIIASLKVSVDSMHGTIKRKNENEEKLTESSNKQLSSLKESLKETNNLIESIRKPSYANVVKRQFRQSHSETPKSSRTSERKESQKLSVQSGTSTRSIFKPPSPIPPRQQRKPHMERKLAEKAVWVSKMHRDISVDEMMAYITEDLGIKDDQLEVRKLVKKDRELSTYSFVSFCIMCSANVFDTLMDVNKWPAYSQIREFEITAAPSTGTKLNERSSPKNVQETPNENQKLQEEAQMDTSQVIH